LDYKFAVALGDSIVIKQVDWELMHFEFDYGVEKYGKVGFLTNAAGIGGNSFMAHIPLRIFVTMDRLNLDISPKFTYYQKNTGYNLAGNANTSTTYNRMRVGGTVAISYGLSDSLSIYLEPGFFIDNQANFNTSQIWNINGGNLVTNKNNTISMSEIPLFAGLMYKVGPGIKLTLGWGYNITMTTTYDVTPGAAFTNNSVSINPRYAKYDFNVQPTEFGYYGDSFMDFGFLKFGGDIAFAQNWTLGIQGGVALNDNWSYTWWPTWQNGYNTSSQAGTTTYSGANNLMTFLNMFNYDNNMYIKYEDDKVAIKGTFMGERNYYPAGSYDAGPSAMVYSLAPNLFGFFGYMDFTVKF
jgi:hypothetical protein